MNYEMFTLQVPVRKHGKPEIVIAGSAEVQKDSVKEYRELKIEFNKGKQAPCADTYLRRETAKERNMNWCEEDGLKKMILLNYTERGKQLRNSRNLQLQQPKVLVLLQYFIILCLLI